MAVVLIAMVVLSPTLQTQTPVSTAPPASGGSGAGTPGAGNGTSTGCTASGNQTGENGDHDGSGSATCTSDPVDHDVQGDTMSSEHRNIAADEHIGSGLEADAIALAELGMVWTATAVHGVLSLGSLL